MSMRLEDALRPALSAPPEQYTGGRAVPDVASGTGLHAQHCGLRQAPEYCARGWAAP